MDFAAIKHAAAKRPTLTVKHGDFELDARRLSMRDMTAIDRETTRYLVVGEDSDSRVHEVADGAARVTAVASLDDAPEGVPAVRDWRELGFRITRVEAFTGGRDNELGALADERGVSPKDGESDESLRQRVQGLADVVSPAAIRRAVNRQLAPYNLTGKAWDVQNGLTGLFADIDFTDYYSPGDIFPIDKQKLIDTDGISYGWFLVFVPILADGEFGGFADQGPVIWLDQEQTFLASAADLCFADGYPASANGVYQAIWEQVNAIRAFGVGFTIIRSTDMNVPPC